MSNFFEFIERNGKDFDDIDGIEEVIFFNKRDMFTHLDLVFFDTTSIYFEGQGDDTLGQKGYRKDHRPDLNQMIVGAVIDNNGRPLCCEMWPGNTADVTTLIPVVDKVRQRFGIGGFYIVADRGMLNRCSKHVRFTISAILTSEVMCFAASSH